MALFEKELRAGRWQRLDDHADIEVKRLKRKGVHYLLARSQPRRQKERAIRRRQRRGLKRALAKLQKRIDDGRLKNRDKILESGQDQSCEIELDLGSGEIPCGPGP